MKNYFQTEIDIASYLSSKELIEDERVRDLCRYSYSTESAVRNTCAALTNYLLRRRGMYVGFLQEISEFLEAHGYINALHALINNRNSLQPVVEQGDYGIMVLTSEAKKAWAAVNHAIETLGQRKMDLPPENSATRN